MRVCEPIYRTGFVALALACGAGPDAGEGAASGDATQSDTAPSETSTSVSSATSGTTDASSSTTTVMPATESTGNVDGTGSTTEGPLGPEVCRTAVTEAECTAASDECHWTQAYRVVDLATCTLDPAPDLQCWARYVEPQNCAEGTPTECYRFDVSPRFREVNGELQLLDYPCEIGPENLGSDPPAWEICGTEKFGPVPPVCYCLCGGAAPDGG